MDDAAVDEYLDRIEAKRPARPDGTALHELHERHLAAVPFENLSIHLGEPIELTGAALFDKIVRQRRGGFCYELNGLFAELLEALGFTVTRFAARVFAEGVPGPPFDHLTLRVANGEASWLVDVGFGEHSRYPLRWDERRPQQDPGGEFQLVDAPNGDLDVLRDGEPRYRIEPRPRDLVDFVPTCWWQQTSPRSHFTQSLICSRETPAGRITLAGRRLIRTEDGRRTEQTLPDDTAVLDAYRQWFGITLDRLPSPPPMR